MTGGLVGARLGDPDSVLISDETGMLNKGARSVGGQRQDTGTAGRIDNSQVAVFGGYASPRRQALLDRRPYLPRKSWYADRDRRIDAAVPDEMEFATTPPLAARMVTDALDAGTPARWVTADEVYGDNRARRDRRHHLSPRACSGSTRRG